MNTATHPPAGGIPAGEARCPPHWSRNYRRRKRLTRKKDGKKTGSFTLPPFRVAATRHNQVLVVNRPGGGGGLSVVAAERGEASAEDVGEQAGMAAVRVLVEVEDGYLCAGRTRSESGERPGQPGRARAAGVGAVPAGITLGSRMSTSGWTQEPSRPARPTRPATWRIVRAASPPPAPDLRGREDRAQHFHG